MAKQIIDSPYLFHNYRRQPVLFTKGRGAYLWDGEGRRYLDFFSGLAVCGLGHANADVARAVTTQIRKLVHTSNIYHTEPQRRLAEQLSRRTFGGRAFFCNSGAEANEAAIKLARRHGHLTPSAGQPRHEIIVFENAFHGRTLGALSATPQKKYQQGFGPLLAGFPVARFGDADSVLSLVSDKTCAVLLEPIQGEGGVQRASLKFFEALQILCRERNLLLMFDEVQTGMGRTGTLFAYQNPSIVPTGVIPDVLTSAKGLANGLPIGAVLAKPAVADLFHPGDHATTFGGGAVVCKAALAVLKVLTPSLMKRVQIIGKKIKSEIESWKTSLPLIQEVRGAGCMWGLQISRPGADLVKMCREAGLLLNCTAENVIRLLPPFCLSDKDLHKGLAILRENLTTLSKT